MNFNHARSDASARGKYICICGSIFDKSKSLTNHIGYEKKLHLKALQQIQEDTAAALMNLSVSTDITPTDADETTTDLEQNEDLNDAKRRQEECE
jgi:hypothetical protein